MPFITAVGCGVSPANTQAGGEQSLSFRTEDCVKTFFEALPPASGRTIKYLNSSKAIPFVVSVIER